MNVAAVVLLAAHSTAIVEVDVVRRVAVDHGGAVVAEKSSEHSRVSRASADKTMLAEHDKVADFRFWLLDLLQFFLFVELVIFRFKIFCPCGREICVAKPNVREKIQIEGLQLLEVPLTSVLVQAEIQLLLFLDIQIHVYNWDGLVSQFLRSTEAHMAANNDVLALWCAVHDDWVYEVEAAQAFLKLAEGFLGDLARVVFRRFERTHRHVHDIQFFVHARYWLGR